MSPIRIAAVLALALAGMAPASGAAAQGGVSSTSAKQSSAKQSSAKSDEKGGASSREASGGVCVPAKVPEEVTSCPDIVPKKTTAGAHAPRSRLRATKRERPKAKKQKPKGPGIEIDAATMRNKKEIKTKARRLLLREIKITKRLIKNTRKNDPQRPEYLLRLAESLFKLGQQTKAKVRSYDEPIYQACNVKKNPAACKKQRNLQKKAEKRLKRVREENIKTLATLVQDHPDFRRMDEVLFSLAFSLEEMQQFDRARQVYHRLIKGYPQSQYIPNAYLSFAEYYFGQGDMRAAQTFYQKVTEIPPERNSVYGYAIYKQAWAFYNLEDFKNSLQKFVEVIEFAENHPEASDAKNLARQARREVVMPYAQVGDPGRALPFFRRYAKDGEQAREMYESLGELYYDTGSWGSATAVYHGLMSEFPDSDKVCYWQTRVTNAVISAKPKPQQVTEVKRMIDLYEAYMSGEHEKKAIKECKQSAASILVDLATAWHRETIGTADQPGTNDRQTMELATKLYRLLLDKFPNLGEMKFPDIAREDWPTEYKVSYYYAELLWKMENWGQCGPAFDRVVELDPKGEFTSDAAYAAVLCYNNLYQQAYQSGETEVRGRDDTSGKDGKESRAAKLKKYKPKEFSKVEEGMLNAFRRYVCFVPDSDDLATIKYRRARIYYEANHFEEASVLFKDIAFNHPDSDLSVYAANLYLDSLNVLGTYREPKRAQCFDDMNESIEPMYGMYCDTDVKREDNADLCGVLEQLRCDLLRKKAETFEEQESWKDAAKVYVGIFRKYPECGKLDEVLYNAAINFEAARLLGRSIKVRKVLIDRYPESKWAERAYYLIGANYHALAIYNQAAEYYEQFAEKYPDRDGSDCTEKDKESDTCAIAHEALQNAVFFRLGLGDEEKAVEDANLFEKNYRRKHPRETSQVVYSLGSIYERQEDWEALIKHYKDYIRRYRRTAMPHEILQAHVKVGRAYWKLGDKRKGLRAFNSAIKAWKRGAPKKIQKVDASAEEKERYLAKAKIAAAESLFYLAEAKFDDFKEIDFPRYRGGKSKERFQKWLAKGFVKWMKEKEAALTEARQAYEKISELEVPQWDIAAAARIGTMYRQFVDDFRDAPVPPSIKGDDELVDIYYQSLDEHSKPWVKKAKDAFEFCLITATKVRWFNEYMTQCEEELFKLDPRQYPRAAELRGSSRYVHHTPAVPDKVGLGGPEGDEDDVGGGPPGVEGGVEKASSSSKSES